MIMQVTGNKNEELTPQSLRSMAEGYDKVVVDLGTGDGKFAYRVAQTEPTKFVIGIDASEAEMKETSHKASRKPAKGGLVNVIFLKIPAEQLPLDLQDFADEMYVNFPWGSLLSGVMLPKSEVMERIVTLAKPGAKLVVTTSYDTSFEPETMSELGLPELNLKYILGSLKESYGDYGVDIVSAVELSDEDKKSFPSSWPKRILSKRDRQVFQITCFIKK